ncbi:MAG: UDP-3-O-acyl-N-acetylglucosamine deacetylase [Clostridia bacterium]|nr:UDP-3-O-acyl-N-acetylglucosamine deacetylase [Deltaproteobacteria bacterium]
MMLRQRTVREKVSCSGMAVHSGQVVTIEVLPAPEDTGITFIRTDIANAPEIRAHVDNVVDTTLATKLAVIKDGTRFEVSTVEHLMAAFTGLCIDNARVLISGPELPILDGSSAPFVAMLQSVGIEEQRKPRRYLVIKKEIRITEGNKEAKIIPSSGFKIKCAVDFDHALIPPTPFNFEFSERSFVRDISRARTFGFLRDVEALRLRGLARGASLDNAVVIDEYRVLNPDGLRYPDEFVRHKVLDCIGDLSLFGMPVLGRLSTKRPGHALNTQLVRKVLADPKAFEIVAPLTAAAFAESPAIEGAFDLEPIETTA